MAIIAAVYLGLAPFVFFKDVLRGGGLPLIAVSAVGTAAAFAWIGVRTLRENASTVYTGLVIFSGCWAFSAILEHSPLVRPGASSGIQTWVVPFRIDVGVIYEEVHPARLENGPLVAMRPCFSVSSLSRERFGFLGCWRSPICRPQSLCGAAEIAAILREQRRCKG